MALGVAKRSLSIKDANTSSRRRSRAGSLKKTTAASKNTSDRRAKKAKKNSQKAVAVRSKEASVKKQTKQARTRVSTTRAKKKTTQTKAKTRKTNKNKTSRSVSVRQSGTKRITKKTSTKAKGSTKRAVADSPHSTYKQTELKNLSVSKPLRKDDANTPITQRDRLGHLLLEQLLRAEGFQGMVTTEKYILDEYSTDESIFCINPQLVLQPKNVLDVEIATRVVARETDRFKSLSLTPRAAGTGLSGGSLTDSVVLDLQEGLTTIGELQYRNKQKDVLITLEAGVKWRDMATVLARAGYHVPTYSTSHQFCTVGGAVANNAAGAMSQKYGHCADFVESLEVVLRDGKRYQIEPLTYKQFRALLKKRNTLSAILEEVFALLEKEEKTITKNQLENRHNTAGYNVWDMLPQGVEAFKKGKGTFDLTKLFAGAQGTIGIVTSVTLRAIPLPETPTTILVPIYDLADLPHVINEAKAHKSLQIEAFDGATYDLALKHPDYFRRHLNGLSYYRSMLAMYTTYHVRFASKMPEFILLISFEQSTLDKTPTSTITSRISTDTTKARVLNNPIEEDVMWLIRNNGYGLSRLQDERKRPSAFVEDMMVPVDALPKYIAGVKKLCREFNLQTPMYGHIGNGHLHLFPLLDFTNKTTPALIEKVSERFFSLAIKHGGTMSAEHNDGIIRTPHLGKLYSKSMVRVFEKLESIFDPADIFNPGKKVNPRFVVREVLRTSNT